MEDKGVVICSSRWSSCLKCVLTASSTFVQLFQRVGVWQQQEVDEFISCDTEDQAGQELLAKCEFTFGFLVDPKDDEDGRKLAVMMVGGKVSEGSLAIVAKLQSVTSHLELTSEKGCRSSAFTNFLIPQTMRLNDLGELPDMWLFI